MFKPPLIAIFSFLAGASPAAAQEQGTPLRSAIDSTFAPHAMPKISGGLEGFNIDLVDEMSKRIHRPITVEGAQFAGLIPALQAGTYDFLAALVTVFGDATHHAQLATRGGTVSSAAIRPLLVHGLDVAFAFAAVFALLASVIVARVIQPTTDPVLEPSPEMPEASPELSIDF